LNRKIAGILLFLCFVAPFATTITYLHFKRTVVRKEVKHQIIAGIKKEELVMLKFSKEDSLKKLKWKHSKEFGYQGQMYDIVKKEIKGDTTYYWCWWDSKETKLSKKLDNILDYVMGNDMQKRESQKRLAKYYKSLYCEELSDYNFLEPQTKKNSTLYEFSSLSYSYPPASPPPKSV